VAVSGDPEEIRVNGALAWAATGGAGLRVMDVSVPGDPRVLARHAVFDSADALAVAEDYIFVGDGDEVHSVPIENAEWTTRYTSVGPAGSAVTWAVSWIQPDADEQVLCLVDAGTCTVTGLNSVANTATVQWTLPNAAGDYEIAVVVGHPATHSILLDRVTVTN